MLCEYILGVCSRPFDGMKAIRQFYQQDIINYADKIFYYQERKFILAEDEEAQENKPGEKFDFFKYNKFLSMKEYKDALQLLKEYDVRALEGKQDIAGLKNQMKNMLYYFLDNLALAEEQKDNLRYEYFRRISQARYEKEYRDVMRQIFEDVMMKADIPQKTVDDRIPKMLAFIEDNYAQDLRLEDMAEEFNFNYHYLSAYFHQHMKEGFSDYLNEIRTAKACELLENTTLSIAEISEKVGYSEHSYFCRVFKKITGRQDGLLALLVVQPRLRVREVRLPGQLPHRQDHAGRYAWNQPDRGNRQLCRALYVAAGIQPELWRLAGEGV